MNYLDTSTCTKTKNPVSGKWLLSSLLIVVAATGLSACSNKDKKPGQSLVKVNGEEITMLQLNGELKFANVPAEQQEAASKQLLESLIDRQLIIAEATRSKIDRSPDVVAAIERAKAQIIAQAYLQDKTAKITKPSPAEIDEYFTANPALFSQRKQFDMRSLLIADKDLSDELKSSIESAKSLESVEAWLVKHGVQFARGKATRNSSDLPPEMVDKLRAIPKGQLFIVNEAGKSMIVAIVGTKDSPVTAQEVAPQIEQYLSNKKNKDIVDAELAHLRSLAKIEYLNAKPAAAATGDKPAVQDTPESKPADQAVGSP